jgi:type II secretory pathway component PulK
MKPGTMMIEHRYTRTPSKERGAILILVMLVLLVLATVVLQIWFTADVDKQVALYQRTYFPIRQAAQGAFMQACSVLLQDLESSGTSGEDSGSGDGEGDGTEPPGGGGEGSGSEGGGDPLGAGDEGASNTDSLVDSWARPGEISLSFSSDVEVQVLIRDEDAKFNILSIMSEDEEFQEKSMERLIRVIDLFREGTRGDLGHGSASEIAGSIKDWMKGDRDMYKFPTPETKTGKMDKDKDELGKEPINFPLTVEELVMCKGITKDLLFGYTEGGERIPGLLEYITVYSNLTMDSQKGDEEEGEADENLFGGGEEDEYGDTPPEEEGDGEGSEGEEGEAVETNNGLINVNTAPLPVLKALVEDSQLSYAVVDRIGEFRDKALEAYRDTMDKYDWNSNEFRNDEEKQNQEEEDDSGLSGFDEDEDEDFIFTDAYAVLDRVEEYFDSTFNIEQDAEDEFCSLLTVTSNVFTVYVTIKAAEGRGSRNFRAVVWRRTGGGGATDPSGSGEYDTTTMEQGEIVILVPLEEYNHPIPITEEELEEMQLYY